MAGESILVVEDAAESLKQTASLLRGAGYRVSIASSAEQALSTLRTLRPELVLVDFMLPGMNGLELTARIRQDSRLQKACVVALTACSMPGDEIRARQAGCNGYLTKPIDPASLLLRIRSYLDTGEDAPGAYAAAAVLESSGNGIAGVPGDELAELRESFLKGGRGVSRQLLVSLEGDFDAGKAHRTVHQWVGSAGLLGFANIARHAQAVETVIRTPPCTVARLRGPITGLARAFYNPEAGEDAGPHSAVRFLNGKRVALIGLDSEAADLVCGALEQAGAKARLFEANQTPYAEAVSICHLVIVHIRPENIYCRWLAGDAPGLPALPTLFLGAPEHVLSLRPKVLARASGLLLEGCLRDETLMRLRLALTQTGPGRERPPAGKTGELVVACGDPSLRILIERAVEGHGLKCRVAANGPETILLLRALHPPVAMVDVSLDGFEALAAIRAEDLPVRAIFATSHVHEDAILRGFSLGGEDYLVQPFSPLELVVRLKRLVAMLP